MQVQPMTWRRRRPTRVPAAMASPRRTELPHLALDRAAAGLHLPPRWSTLRNDRLTGRNEYARTTGAAGKFSFNFNDARLVWIAAGIAIALITVMFVPDLVREGRTQTVGELLAAAQTNLNAAANEGDPAQRRFYLEETRRLAAEALRLEQENVSATELHGQERGRRRRRWTRSST